MRKKILEKRMQRLEAKKAALVTRAKASQDVNEVRSINEQLEDINAEIAETREEIEAIDAEKPQQVTGTEDGEQRNLPPMGAQQVNGGVVAHFGMGETGTQTRENTDPFATLEYRQAFMKYAQTGAAIPANLYKRDGEVDATATTTSLGAIIPTTVLNEFIEGLSKKVYGNLYSKVRKLNIKGGVKVPIKKLQATFKWVAENAVSKKQDGGEAKDFVEFSYNVGEIRVAETLLASITTLDLFETEIVQVMINAYLEAMDKGIISGTGEGQMLGLVNDPRVTEDADCIVEMTAAEFSNWTQWRKKFFAKLPLAYRAGEFIFPQATVDAYLETMADANNNPIFKQAADLEINDGDVANGGRFFGRTVSLVEPDVIADFDSAAVGDVVGIFWQPKQYAINSNMTMGLRRYFDEDTNEYVNKLLVIVDGKVLDPKGVRLIKKKA